MALFNLALVNFGGFGQRACWAIARGREPSRLANRGELDLSWCSRWLSRAAIPWKGGQKRES